MTRTKILFGILAIVAVVWIVEITPDTQQEKPPLDYSKPVYTEKYAVVCPLGLLFSVRADVQDEIKSVFFMPHFSLSDEAKQLGCEELVGGLQVEVVHMQSPLDSFVQINGTLFSVPSYLTNNPSQ